MQERQLLEVIGLDNCHQCRGEPFEAAICSLEAKGDLQKFKSSGRADLTVAVEQPSDQQEEKTHEHSSLELPVDFCREDVSKV